MEDSIVAVAKKGKDVSVITDPNDFVFHTNFNTFKIIAELTTAIALAASTSNQSFSVAHGLSYVPVAAAFAKESSLSQVFLPNSGNVSIWSAKGGWTDTGIKFNYIKTDGTNITFNFDNSNGSIKNVNIRYFLLEKI